MTVEDLLAEAAIRRLIHAYAQAGDNQDKDGAAAHFALDGVLRVAGRALSGRGEIAALLKQFAARHGNAPMVRHNITTSVIEVTGEAATGCSYYLVVDEHGPSHQGRYLDRFVRSEGRWLIAERDVTLDWKAPR